MDNNELVMNADGMIINGFDPRQYAAEHPDRVRVVDAPPEPRYELTWEDLTAALHGVEGAAADAADAMGTMTEAIDGIAADIRGANIDARATADGGVVTREHFLDAIRNPHLNMDAPDFWDVDPNDNEQWRRYVEAARAETAPVMPREMEVVDLTDAADTYRAGIPMEPWIGETVTRMGRAMSLDEGTVIAIRITGEQEFRLNFAGYFSQTIMDEVVSQYIGENDAGIIQETGAIVFRYCGNVVAVTPDHYHTQECFDTFEDGVMVHHLAPQAIRYGISPEHIELVWNCDDETVGTKEPLVDMDRAFDEVFQ